jgi:hypothetical protein
MSRAASLIDPALLDRFTGYYRGKPFLWAIKREGNTLTCGIVGQSIFDLLPENETKFFYRNPAIHAQISFVIDGQRRTTSAILHMNGSETIMPRIGDSEGISVEKELRVRRERNEPAPNSERLFRRLKEMTTAGTLDEEELLESGFQSSFTINCMIISGRLSKTTVRLLSKPLTPRHGDVSTFYFGKLA